MDLRRLRLGESAALVGAVVVLVSLFLDWATYPLDGNYVLRGYGAPPTPVESGLQSAGAVLVALLVVVAVLALTLVVLTVTVEPVGLTMAVAVGTAFSGIALTVATLLRVALFQPDAGFGDSGVHMRYGAYLTLLGVFLCAAGGWITMKDERQSAPYSAAPVLEPRPAPPADPPA